MSSNPIYDTTYSLGTYSITDTTMGSSGHNYNIYTTTGTDTITIADYANGWTGQHGLDVKGDANFEGDVKIKGKSLVESLEKIEEKLAILHPNEELEEKWERLRSLRKMYMELEAEIKEKENIWGILKK
jgi:hypothetical protein